jgi:cytochrome c biogenesis protein CcmG, thiol:disulfide interchange protein DsbE
LLISQILAVIGASYLLMLSGRPAFGANLPPISGLTSHDRLAIYWVTLLGTGALFGVIDLIAAVLGGALAGYLSRPAQPAPGDPILLTNSDISNPAPQTPRQNHHKAWLIATLSVCGLCLLACVGLIGFSGLGKSTLNALAFNNTVGIGKPAPDFTLTTLSGTAVTLTSLKGQPVVLSFGASWCPDCAAEAPILETIHQKYPKLAILAIDSKEPAALVQGFIKDHSLTFDMLMDPNGVVNNRYHIYAIPTLFFIDQNGVVRDIIIEKLTLAQMEQCLGKIGVGV